MYVLSDLAQLESHFFVSEFWREKYSFIFAIIQTKQFTWWRWGHRLDRYFAPFLSPDVHIISPDSLWQLISILKMIYCSLFWRKKPLDIYFHFYFLQELSTWFIFLFLLSTKIDHLIHIFTFTFHKNWRPSREKKEQHVWFYLFRQTRDKRGVLYSAL